MQPSRTETAFQRRLGWAFFVPFSYYIFKLLPFPSRFKCASYQILMHLRMELIPSGGLWQVSFSDIFPTQISLHVLHQLVYPGIWLMVILHIHLWIRKQSQFGMQSLTKATKHHLKELELWSYNKYCCICILPNFTISKSPSSKI